MGKLIYCAIASLDGYVEDAAGGFDWAAPDEEVFAFANELERSIGTSLYGRRMYETMLYWETAPTDSDMESDFAQMWRQGEKVVYSTTLAGASSERTRIERRFDTNQVRQLKEASERDLAVAGANLAGQALAAGLVDELQLFVHPVIVGSGKPWLPGQLRLALELTETRSFESGVVFLRYRLED